MPIQRTSLRKKEQLATAGIPHGREQELKPAAIIVTGAGETSVFAHDDDQNEGLLDPDYGAGGIDNALSDLHRDWRDDDTGPHDR